MNVEAGTISGGPDMGAAISTVGSIGQIVNEGPVAPAFLENTMPLSVNRFNPIGEIIFKPSEPLVIQQAESIASEAWAASEPLKAEAVVAEANHWLGVDVMLEGVLSEVEGRPIASIQNEDSIASPASGAASLQNDRRMVNPQVETVVASQLVPNEQEAEEVIEEKVAVEESKESLEEEDLMQKRLYLEDEKASGQRRYEIKAAILEAKAEAERLGLTGITGWLVAKFLPAEHEGNRSQALKEQGPDGSYLETVQAIALSGEFDSEAAAQERFNEIVTKKKPVKNGQEGNPVKNEDVARVFKYRIVKPPLAYEITVKRVKQKAPVPSGQIVQTQTATKAETSLEDYPELAEVFQKAA